MATTKNQSSTYKVEAPSGLCRRQHSWKTAVPNKLLANWHGTLVQVQQLSGHRACDDHDIGCQEGNIKVGGMRKIACVRIYLILQQEGTSVPMLHPVNKPHNIKEGDELQRKKATAHRIPQVSCSLHNKMADASIPVLEC